MSLATLSTSAVTRCRVQVPAWGCWWAGVDLAEPAAITGTVALTIAGTAMTCTKIGGGAANGRAAYRMVSGAGGWGKDTPKKSYADDSGVKLSKVLGDLAREVGETLGTVPTTRLGPRYARPAAPAYETLNALAPKNWYVDFAGVTHIGARSSAAYTGNAPRVRVDPAIGVIDLAVDSLAQFLPGVTVDGSLPATDVEIDLTPERLTARVYANAQSSTSARLEAMAEVLAALDPRARFRTLYEYRVVVQVGDRLNLQPVRVADKLDDLAGVPVRGPAGIGATVLPGETVVVAFLGGDPSRPCVIAHDERDAPGWMPLAMVLGGPVALPIAYQGSTAQCGPFGGAVLLGSTLASVRP